MENNKLKIRAYQAEDQRSVIKLWIDCELVVPQNNPEKDIEMKMAFQPDLFLVGTLGDKIVATAMAGYEGHRGWINYLAVAPDHQKSGFGRLMVYAAEEKLKALGCPKLNVQIRSTNTAVIEFYKRIGFGDDLVMGMGKRF